MVERFGSRFGLATAAAVAGAWLLFPASVSGQNYVTQSVCPEDDHAKFHACASAPFRPSMSSIAW